MLIITETITDTSASKTLISREDEKYAVVEKENAVQ
tara:strand:+ start:513 stop:620 length:108 start_codon:yes stop_codon:yes gene_type:complete